MDWMALLFALGLFAIGFWILIDERRFRGRARRAIAFVEATERVESKVSEGRSDGRYRTRPLVTWKTRLTFKDAQGHAQATELELPDRPGEVVTLWYDPEIPGRARAVRSRGGFGWTLIGTGLIPFGFWLLEIFDVLP